MATQREGRRIGAHIAFAVIFLLFFGTLLFVFWNFLQQEYLENKLANFLETGVSLEETLLNYLFIGSFAFVFVLALILYLGLSIRERATHMANRMMAEAVQSQQMLLQLYEQSPIPYLMMTPNGKVQFPNKAALRLFDATAEELEDQTFSDLVLPEHKEHVDVALTRFKRKVPINEEEIQIQSKLEGPRWVILSIYALQNASGGAHNGLISLVDITERKEVDKAKTEFVSLASHQLRTPLSSIKWYTELLISGDFGELDEKQLKYVKKVHKGNERMIDLVNTLLNVSRLELGTIVVEKKPTDLIDLAESVLEELQSQINVKKIQIERQYGEIPIYDTDPKLMRMVLQNLLSNAVKYTPEEGNVRLNIGTSGTTLQVLVADNGMGIPEEQQDKMFSKLFRADNARAKVAVGTGLGLYIVKAIIEEFGGSIKFTSKIDTGTTFTVQLPL